MNKPIYGTKNTQVTAHVVKISPSTSDMANKTTIANLKKQIALIKTRLDRRNIKVSKVAESYVINTEIFI